MALLSDGEKKRIAAEVEGEQYRASLIPREGLSGRALKFINTPIFLWFLSAVVVSGASALITQRAQESSRASEWEQRLQKAMYEFGARWQKLRKLTNRSSPGADYYMGVQESEYFSILFAPPIKWTTGPIFPEYKDVTLLGVAYEIELLHDSDSAKRSIRDMRNTLLALEGKYVLKIEGDPNRSERLYKATDSFAREWRTALGKLNYRGDVIPWDDKHVNDFDWNAK